MTNEIQEDKKIEGKPERAPWGDFPKAITNGFINDLSKLEHYESAKNGDALSALLLIRKLLKQETIEQIKQNFKPDKDTVISPVLAEEQSGKNKIPLAMAKIFARKLGVNIDLKIFQARKAKRTGSNSSHRLALPPVFSGEVDPNKKYILVDDTLTQGGTLASMRGYIENRGGKVIGFAVMSSQEYSLQVAPTQEILDTIKAKHGDTMNQFFMEEFGYGIEQLTNSEARQVERSNNVDEIRIRITQARYDAGFRIDGSGINTLGSSGFANFIDANAKIKEFHPKAILKTEPPANPTTPSVGLVVFISTDFIVQQVAENSRFFQVYQKKDLSSIPNLGERVKIVRPSSNNAQYTVTPIQEKTIKTSNNPFGSAYPIIKKLHSEAILKTEKTIQLCKGKIVFAGNNFIVQQMDIGSKYFQVHLHSDLKTIPQLGEIVRIKPDLKTGQLEIISPQQKQVRKI